MEIKPCPIWKQIGQGFCADLPEKVLHYFEVRCKVYKGIEECV